MGIGWSEAMGYPIFSRMQVLLYTCI
jgi:hypothetical protein